MFNLAGTYSTCQADKVPALDELRLQSVTVVTVSLFFAGLLSGSRLHELVCRNLVVGSLHLEFASAGLVLVVGDYANTVIVSSYLLSNAAPLPMSHSIPRSLLPSLSPTDNTASKWSLRTIMIVLGMSECRSSLPPILGT